MPDEPTFKKQPVPGAPPEGDDLQLLKRQLYARDVPAELSDRTKKLADVPARNAEIYAPLEPGASAADFADVLNDKRRTRKKIWLWTGSALAVVLVFGAAVGGTL